MKPFNWLRLNGRPEEEALLRIVPPRSGERTLLGVENLLQALAVKEPFSLEIAGTEEGVAFYVRTSSPTLMRQQIGIHYPQARIEGVPQERDPLHLREGERAWIQKLDLEGPAYLPLRTFRDDDFLDAGSDPLLAILGALGSAGQGQRLVARLILRSVGTGWSAPFQRRAHVPAFSSVTNPAYQYQTRPLMAEGGGLVALMGLVLLTLTNYVWLGQGKLTDAVLLDVGAGALLVGAAAVAWRWLRRSGRLHDQKLIQEKIARPAFAADLHLLALVPAEQERDAAKKLFGPLATAFHHYDLAAGNRFRDGAVRLGLPKRLLARPGQANLLTTREVATLWHPPRGGDEVPALERSGARTIHPLIRGVRRGALVGTTTGGREAGDVRFSEDLLRQHHLYVAKTRMGKSTLMQHVIAHKLREKAEGRDPDAIVVVDPHSDLFRSMLGLIPRSLVDEVYLVDLADQTRVPGINLLDAELFPNRDRATDNVIHVVKNLWEQWGPRMQSILEHTLKSLFEANRHPSVTRDRQYTVLDGLHLLSDESFRAEVLSRVRDPYLIRWWAKDFRDWHRQYRADAVAPVQTRLAYYASSERARTILGQSASTLDLRKVIDTGGVLLVNTAQGEVGRDVAALIGGTVLNLLDSVIRTQVSLPPEQRRRVTVVIDEMQAIPGADYESMLSELGKYGASFVMATQSLARLEELSKTLRETVFSNIGCLVSFQVSAYDARYLTWEFDRDQVAEADLTSLAVHHCYVRATVGGERLPTFSMALRPPQALFPDVADDVRRRVDEYTAPTETISTRLEAEIEELIAEFREEQLRKRRNGKDEGGEAPADPPGPNDRPKPRRPRPRSRRRPNPDLPTGGSADPGPTGDAGGEDSDRSADSGEVSDDSNSD